MGSWDTRESEGFFNEGDVYIENPIFGYDALYGEPLIFIMEGRSLESPLGPEGNYAVRQFFSVGTGWEPQNGGANVIHVEGKEDFHASSAYARFFNAALELGGDIEKVLKGRGYPDDAKIWTGLAFHMERMDVDFGSPIGVKKILTPTAFLGELAFPGPGAAAGVASAAPAVDPAAAAAAAKAAAAAAAAGGTGTDWRAEVVALAATSETHDVFLTSVFGKWPNIETAPFWADVIAPAGAIWTEAHPS